MTWAQFIDSLPLWLMIGSAITTFLSLAAACSSITWRLNQAFRQWGVVENQAYRLRKLVDELEEEIERKKSS